MMTRASLPFELNGIELITLLTFAVLLGRSLVKRGAGLLDTVAFFALVIPVLVLTVSETTQFMTMDEWGISLWLLSPTDRLSPTIMLGLYGTGATLQLPVARLLDAIGVHHDTIRMLLKALWWLIGNAIFFQIARNVVRLSGMQARAPILGVVFVAIAMLPTSQLAVKTLNYDLLSMGLAVWAVVLALRGFLKDDGAPLICAIILGSLAAQEKPLAGPVLVLLIVSGAVWWSSGVVGIIAKMRRAALTAATLCIIPIALSLVSRLICGALGATTLPVGFISSSVDPISSWTWFLVGAVMSVTKHANSTVGLVIGNTYRLPLTIVAVVLIACGAALADLVIGSLTKRNPTLVRSERDLPAAVPLLLLLALFGGGFWAVSNVSAYWAPYHPSRLPSNAVIQAFGETTLHFDATTALGHMAAAVAHATAVIMVAIPSSVWIGVLVIALAPALIGARDNKRAPLASVATLLILLGTLLPLAMAAIGIPFAHRYFNTWILIIVVAILLLGLNVLPSAGRAGWASLGVCTILAAFLFQEMAPFRPLFAAYRPFWLEYGDAKNAESGRLNASWMGWGEEILRLGKTIDRACMAGDPVFEAKKCSDVTLHVMISGRWLPGPEAIKLKAFEEPTFDSGTFVAFNRLLLIQNMYNRPTIEPDFVAAYRGYNLGWAYRGDRLRDSGYMLK